ncbi:flavin-binding monooxygenase-like family protein [Roridomyces roridus]|uniref:Flavin-binding monooxygenase-like family protein n=1 Tax=Roridomyces roridus TaxID=1738132 RepID=A0AAD7BMK8_9AGAR|nr:flavin-binding monooxygenase-like family protein [Roridomyces roridus]
MATTDHRPAIPDATIQQKYAEERHKRLRPDGVAQFLNLATSDKFKYLREDPWVDHAALNAQTPPLKNGDEIKFLVQGAGYGGLMLAVNLIEAGFKAEDIRLVDEAGGFGGTWYWNRYPGLMCDTESYTYMPFLEETGYMPRFRYSYGSELREHADRIAEKWGLTDKTLFRTNCHHYMWDDAEKRWIVHGTENRGPAEGNREIQLKAQYVLVVPGFLGFPHIARLPGFDKFRGEHFHTARWNYDITGGNPTHWNMEKLKDKTVGIVGTGATAIQAIPQLGNWAKHLYVFQRTPSSVDERGQHPTDPNEWANKIASKKGWQYARSKNFLSQFTMDTPIDEDQVNDRWCSTRSYCGFIGAPGIVSPDKTSEHVAALHSMDLERAERVRQRTTDVVKDPATAAKLKAWYPAWCKRPTFHDDYLPTFNKPNVTLVDTNGKGLDALTEEGVMANGTEYPLDVLVLSTGYSLFVENDSGSPVSRAGMTVVGRDGLSMDDKWIRQGSKTLHGVATHGFPNFFFTGPTQVALAVNFTHVLSALASHVAQILVEAERRVDQTERITIEVTEEGEDAYTAEVVKRATSFAGVGGCTPGYYNKEGQASATGPQEQAKEAQGNIWGEGPLKFEEFLNTWRAEGRLEGIEIKGNVM